MTGPLIVLAAAAVLGAGVWAALRRRIPRADTCPPPPAAVLPAPDEPDLSRIGPEPDASTEPANTPDTSPLAELLAADLDARHRLDVIRPRPEYPGYVIGLCACGHMTVGTDADVLEDRAAHMAGVIDGVGL